MSESVVPESGRGKDNQGNEIPRRTELRPKPVSAPPGGIGLRFYKPGQGFYTRVGTAIGAGILIVSGAIFVFNELSGLLVQQNPYRLPIQYGVTTGFIFLMGVMIYWLVGRHRRINDFFIATEGEMKKVSWSTRKEVIRSTKVVIFSVIMLGVFLFLADIMFMLFFGTIGVLKGPGLARLLGFES
ncbi:MAG: preprotein translocase subunit SecE [Planctomycetota bacterium]